MSEDLDDRRRRQREAKAKKRRDDPEHERALRRAYYLRNAEKIAKRNLEKRSKERERAVSRRDVARAIASGQLVVGECEIGGDCFGAIEAHHEDYSKPLEVRWLCKSHHMRLHSPLTQETWRLRGIKPPKGA